MPVLPGRRGSAYTVSIDSLVDQMLLMATQEGATGAYNAIDATVPWERYFSYFAEEAGVKLRRLPWGIVKAIAKVADVVPTGLPITTQRLAFYHALPSWPMTNAEEELAWEACVAEEEEFRRGVGWLR